MTPACLPPADRALASLLYAFWMSWVVLVLATWKIPFLNNLTAYGKTLSPSASKTEASALRPTTWFVPHELFLHFYVVGVAVSLLVLILGGSPELKDSAQQDADLIWARLATDALGLEVCERREGEAAASGVNLVSLLFLLHTTRRLYEERLNLNTPSARPKARMHLSGYAVGMIFYCATPVSLALFGRRNEDPKAWADSLGWVRFLVGLGLFLEGSRRQYNCHAILRALKGRPTYSIPRGDLFEVASSGHYLAEFIIYAGLVVLSFDPAKPYGTGVLLVYGFVLCNLSLTAERTHQWYLDKFRDAYPANRARVIPGVF